MSRSGGGFAKWGRGARALAAWFVLGCGAPALAQNAPLRPPLALDAHAVGFTSHGSLDPARAYDTTFADGTRYAAGGPAARPILVDVWYPAARPSEAEPRFLRPGRRRAARGARPVRHRPRRRPPVPRGS